MEHTISTDQQIINTLLLNASFINYIGLMHGKIGISIFFIQLARDEIYRVIIKITHAYFENVFVGNSWGIEYFTQNGFIETNTENLLEEFDNRIFEVINFNTPKEISLINGIIGAVAYFNRNIQSPKSNVEKTSNLFIKQILMQTIDYHSFESSNFRNLPLFKK